MKIPDKIQIAGRVYDVIFSDELTTDNSEHARIEPDKCKIIIQSSCKGNERSKQGIEITFIHEIIHAISKGIGNYELYNDEKFTDQFTELLYQVIKQI